MLKKSSTIFPKISLKDVIGVSHHSQNFFSLLSVKMQEIGHIKN